MPLIPYADTAALPDAAREAFERLPRKLNIFRMWANAPACFTSGIRFGGNILARQKLDPALRELVILLVARLEGGTYEWVQHVPIAEAAGCKKEKIGALEGGLTDSDVFSAQEKALLGFSREVIRNVKASEESVARASEFFSPQEIVEIILTCGFYMTMARLTETTRTDIDPPEGSEIIEALTRLG
jgi:alkylhydroperoxidase family enzyme